MTDIQNSSVPDRKIFIQRDYSQGLSVRFSTDFPEELIRKIDENTWVDLIKELNAKFASIEGATAGTVCETVVGCLTCYILSCCMTPLYKKKMDGIADFIDEINHDVLLPKKISMANPIEKGFRVLEITLINEKERRNRRINDSSNTNSIATPALQPRI